MTLENLMEFMQTRQAPSHPCYLDRCEWDLMRQEILIRFGCVYKNPSRYPNFLMCGAEVRPFPVRIEA